jgi:hypothetical protein
VFSGRRSVEGHLREEELSVPKVSLRGNIVPRNGYMREYDQIARHCVARECFSRRWFSSACFVCLRLGVLRIPRWACKRSEPAAAKKKRATSTPESGKRLIYKPKYQECKMIVTRCY